MKIKLISWCGHKHFTHTLCVITILTPILAESCIQYASELHAYIHYV